MSLIITGKLQEPQLSLSCMPASPGPPVRDARFFRTKPSELEKRRKCTSEGTSESRMFKRQTSSKTDACEDDPACGVTGFKRLSVGPGSSDEIHILYSKSFFGIFDKR